MNRAPKPSEVRFRVDPGDVPAEKAARRLHLTLAQFNEMLPDLAACSDNKRLAGACCNTAERA